MKKTYSSACGFGKRIHIDCPVCDSHRFRTKMESEEYVFVKCSSCGLVYQNPRPDMLELQERYASDYFEYEVNNEANFFNLMKLGLADIGFNRIVKEKSENRSFLDIGCATGMLLQHMKEQGWTVSGVDLCRESALHGIRERGVPIFIGSLEDAKFPDKHFSVIHFSHLIEHVIDPKSLLREVKRILKDSGFAIITTPNIDGLQARLLGKNWRSAIADHLHLFSKKTLFRLLSDLGFSIEKIVTWGGIALGLAPGYIKAPLDRLAKKFGFGDVMLFLVRKTS